MDALLTTIVLWLSINFNLPGTFDLPKVEFVRPIEITFFRYQAFTAEAQPAAKGAQDRVFPSGPEREHPSVLPRATRRRICRRSERAYRGPLEILAR